MALEDALTEFEGTVLLISHDRALLEAVGSRTLVCEGGQLRSHDSGWAEYQRRRDEEDGEPGDGPPGDRGEAPGAKRQRTVKTSQKAARKVARLEDRIARAEAELAAIEDELSDPGAWSSPGRYERATERHTAAKRTVEELYAEWEEAQTIAESSPTTAGNPR